MDVAVAQPLSHLWSFLMPWTAALQASLSFTTSWSLFKFMSIESVMVSNHLILCFLFTSCLQFFPASGSFPMSQLITWGAQSFGTSASASVLPKNIQGWFPLGLTNLASLLSKGLSRVFYSTTVQEQQFFGTHSSLWPNSRIHTWLEEKPWLWLDGPLLANCVFFLIYCLGLS